MICEAFQCTPAEAEAQDPFLVDAVLDYRAARMAVDTFNEANKQEAFRKLKDSPYLLSVLSKMSRAQRGLPLHAPRGAIEDEAMGVAEAYRSASDEAEEDSI